ncbi:MAG: periplasmic sensor signal transduction histidine kinase [Proteobacteria bacterium]|nr:periplasmic sensor signal transduction histidine kinase [Pseudomonadota bacterium]
MNIGTLSYLAGFIASFLLTILLLISWRGHPRGRWLIAACGMMTVWAGSIALDEAYGVLSTPTIATLEILHTYAWLVFFNKLLHRGGHSRVVYNTRIIRAGIHLLAWGLIAYVWGATGTGSEQVFQSPVQLSGLVGLQVVGLVIIEHYYRNARLDQRWRIKFLCFALGVLFVYDFYIYSDALLFHTVREDFWAARGMVVAMLTPFIAVAAARNPDWSVDIFVSRQVVFHSAALLGTGMYLILVGFGGYYIEYYGGEWGRVGQIVFLVAAALALMVVVFSGQMRARLKVFLNKHFFNYLYDYRQEWLRLITTLSEGRTGLSLGERVILALGQIVESPSGVLWLRESGGRLVHRASYGDPEVDVPVISADEPIIRFIREREWVVNLEEMASHQELYEGLSIPDWLEPYRHAWLLLPLWGKEQSLDGLVLLTEPRTDIAWNWEVIDMLKTAGRMAAGYLALEEAAGELAEARQFEGFNRLSAFVIHDLKNLVAQLTLVVRNAEKHQDNPEFMRDAITTVDHAVDKMNGLMSQLRNSSSAVAAEPVNLGVVLREVIALRKKQPPAPELAICNASLVVKANRDRLASALEHIIHNAQDAAGKSGRVRVSMHGASRGAAIVEVEDNGCGMDDEFIRTRLFRPFDTTKGLTGMGIGAYESREYIRSMGGDLTVRSEPGKGSVFFFRIPLAEEESGISMD